MCKDEKMNSNAFIAGVKPGGLTTDYEVKILICYLMNVVKVPLNISDFNYILITEGLVNYFECTQSLSDLLHLNNISQLEDNSYVLTEKGINTAINFERTIPLTVKETAVSKAKRYLKYKEMEKLNIANIEKLKEGFNVSLNIGDDENLLMKITMFAPNDKYCEKIKEEFYKSPEEIYQIVASLLIGETDNVYSILAKKTLREHNQ